MPPFFVFLSKREPLSLVFDTIGVYILTCKIVVNGSRPGYQKEEPNLLNLQGQFHVMTPPHLSPIVHLMVYFC